MLTNFIKSIIAFFRKLFGCENAEGGGMDPRNDEWGYIEIEKLWEYGIEVRIPDQKSGESIIPVSGPMPKEEIPGEEGFFEPNRWLLNLAFSTKEDPTAFLRKFDPPIGLRIWFTERDLAFAQEEKKELKIAFWNGKQWIVFEKEKHEVELVRETRKGYIGFLSVKLPHWDDPPINIGRR